MKVWSLSSSSSVYWILASTKLLMLLSSGADGGGGCPSNVLMGAGAAVGALLPLEARGERAPRYTGGETTPDAFRISALNCPTTRS